MFAREPVFAADLAGRQPIGGCIGERVRLIRWHGLLAARFSSISWWMAMATTLAVTPARADGPLGPEGSPLGTSQYKVDLFQGPVLASSRITALAGAYAPLGEGADGHAFNAASPAVRFPYSTNRFDWDLNLSVTFPVGLRTTDFDNNGTPGFRYSDFYFVTAGGQVQYGPVGVGATLDLQTYNLGRLAETTADLSGVTLRLGRAHALAGYSLASDQLYVGGGARILVLEMLGTRAGGQEQVLTGSGAAPELGALWAPHTLPIRAGLTLRAPVDASTEPGSEIRRDALGDLRIGAVFIPERVVLPWEIEWGLATQIGPRPLNIRWMDAKSVSADRIDAARRTLGGRTETREETSERVARNQYRSIPRAKLLVLSSFLVTGPVDNAVGFESSLSQIVNRSGRKISFTPRLGVEAEAIPGWLQLRGGTYIEPTRYGTSTPRAHGTAGFELKVFCSSVWGFYPEGTCFRAGAALDVTRQYYGWAFSVGLWR